MADQQVFSGMQPPPQGQKPSAAPAHPVKKQPATSDMLEKVTHGVNNMGASLRILEERFSLMRNKTQVTEESMIELQKGLSKDLKLLNDDITELKHELKDILDKMRLIDAEMKNLTKKDELKILERYLDMWQPMNFITRAELDRLLEDLKPAQPRRNHEE